jgi:hypothetical protein
MLARVDEVPWDRLSGASGAPATHLAETLAHVAAPVRDAALQALDAVRDEIWRDGAIFELTAHVVPFLVELALSPMVIVRPPILQLLAFLYGGEGPTLMELHGGAAGAAIQSRLSVEREWVEATRAAVRRPLHDYLSLLSDEDRDVRIAAACLVTVFRDRDAEPEVRRALTRRFGEEQDEVVRATLLGSLNVYLPSSHLELYDLALENDPSLLVRREAAHSLAAVLREETPQLAAATLLEAVLRAAELGPLYAGVAWNRRGVVADSVWAVTRMGPNARNLLRYLEKLVRRVPPRDGLQVAEAALLIAFEGPASSRSLADLAPDQTALLRSLADTDGIWGQELPQMLAHYGLPRDQASLRALLSRS